MFDGLLFEDGEIPANLHDWSVGGPSRIVDKVSVSVDFDAANRADRGRHSS